MCCKSKMVDVSLMILVGTEHEILVQPKREVFAPPRSGNSVWLLLSLINVVTLPSGVFFKVTMPKWLAIEKGLV